MGATCERFDSGTQSLSNFYLEQAMLACDSAANESPHAESATMILDLEGNILCCNHDAVRLFKINERAIVRRQVRLLIPELPLRSTTPGYNLAYVLFWATGEPWRVFSIRNHQGQLFGVRVRLEQMELNRVKHIVLRLRPIVSAPKRSERSAYLQQRQSWATGELHGAALELIPQ